MKINLKQRTFSYKEVLEILFQFAVEKKRLTNSKVGEQHAETWLKIFLIETGTGKHKPEKKL